MMLGAMIQFEGRLGLLMMAGAALAVYVASRAAVDALVGRDEPAPGRQALGHWLPIALVAVGAAMLRQGSVAVGVIFASSVASLSLVLGLVAYLSGPVSAPARWRRVWLFLLPMSVLALVIGFWGHISPYHAMFLLLQGLLVLMVWLDREPADTTDAGEPAPVMAARPLGSRRSPALRTIELVLAVALAAVGAAAGLLATDRVVQETFYLTPPVVAMVLLAPILVLPMIGAGGAMAQRGQAWAAATTSVCVAMLNLCVLLPAVVLIWNFTPPLLPERPEDLASEPQQQQSAPQPSTQSVTLPATTPPATTAPATSPATQSATAPATAPDPTTEPLDLSGLEEAPEPQEPPPLVYPLAVWRVDTVLLIVLSLLLLPVALNRWPLGRWAGLALIVAYALYLLTAVVARLFT